MLRILHLIIDKEEFNENKDDVMPICWGMNVLILEPTMMENLLIRQDYECDTIVAWRVDLAVVI